MCVVLISCRSRLSRLEGFEWTLHCGEGQLRETGERLLNGCLRPLNSVERRATISESGLQAFVFR